MSYQGTTIGGRYQLGKLIEAGGVGHVYRAKDHHMGIDRQLAVKVIPYADTEAASVVEYLEREVRGITKLNHPHILLLFDYGIEPQFTIKFAYLVMPYCEEGSLDQWYQNHPLSPKDVAYFIVQAASAIQGVHNLAEPIIHKDIKPKNFLLRKNIEDPEHPDLLLADFGIAKLSTAPISIGNYPSGTPLYMPPEQWEGHPTPATDQYALAVTSFQLLTGGHFPFESKIKEELREMHLEKSPALPSMFNPDLPKAFDDVIHRALMKKPDDRYPSVSAFAEVFKQAAFSEEKGDDIHLLLTLSEAEALVGTTHQLSLPQGDAISITIPPGTKNGEKIFIAGKGAPSRFGGPTGTLIATILTRPDTSNEQIIIQQLQEFTLRLDRLESSISAPQAHKIPVQSMLEGSTIPMSVDDLPEPGTISTGTIDTADVLKRVRRGDIPSTWQALQPSPNKVKKSTAGERSALATFNAIGILMIIPALLIILGVLHPSTSASDNLGGGIVLLIFGASLWIGTFTGLIAHRGPGERYFVPTFEISHVLLPQGCVLIRNERVTPLFNYGEIESIHIKNGFLWIKFPNKKRETPVLNLMWFESLETLEQHILSAYAQFKDDAATQPSH